MAKSKSKSRSSGKKSKKNTFNNPLKVSGPLVAVIGKTSVSRPQATKKFWAYIKKNKLQAKSGSDVSVTYKGKTYKGGQVILCGGDKNMKKLCGGNAKISMVQLAVFMKPCLK